MKALLTIAFAWASSIGLSVYQAFVMSKFYAWFLASVLFVTVPFGFWFGLSLISTLLLTGLYIAIDETRDAVLKIRGEEDKVSGTRMLSRMVLTGFVYTFTLLFWFTLHCIF